MQAMILAKEELGKDALVVNVKSIRPKGIYRLFKKPIVEITAAVDDYPDKKKETKEVFQTTFEKERVRLVSEDALNRGDILLDDSEEEPHKRENNSELEDKLNNLQSLLEKQIVKVNEEEKKDSIFDTPTVKLIRKQLIDNEVSEEVEDQILREIQKSISKDSSVDNVLSNVYQKIILKLGQPATITINNQTTKFVFFVGPTGVGKTTTIAKIASSLKLKHKVKVALITLDTYRIAAVEQLRTYANILGIPLQVIYSVDEVKNCREEYSDYDIVLVDTAGRSHKNIEQLMDVADMIKEFPDKEKEVYLVLSATTKYKDLLQIIRSYEALTDYRIVFTKLDETSTLGNLLNIRMLTRAPLSYTTYGQNVPDDISKANSRKIAKQLLGGND